MYDFYRARIRREHMNKIKKEIKQYFPNLQQKFTLEDFNKICGRVDKN